MKCAEFEYSYQLSRTGSLGQYNYSFFCSLWAPPGETPVLTVDDDLY